MPAERDDARIMINGAFRDQRITGQQRYATEIASRLLGRPGVREWSLPRRSHGSRVGAWASVQFAGARRSRDERLLTLTSRGPLAVSRHVVTVHDTFVIDTPEWFSRAYVATHAPVLSMQVRNAELVLAVSEPVAATVRTLVGPGTEVVVVPNAPGDDFRPGLPAPTTPAAVAATHAADGFVLSVASEDPRKNLGRLVAAHRELPDELRRRYPLLLAGGASAVFAGSELDLDESIVRLGYVDDDELARLYAAASVVAFPSLAEGFGLPAVEAIASGSQVVVSDLPVLRWVCREDARYADPLSVPSIAGALRAAIEDPTPAAELERRARAVRERFTWQRSADLVAAAVGGLSSVGGPGAAA